MQPTIHDKALFHADKFSIQGRTANFGRPKKQRLEKQHSDNKKNKTKTTIAKKWTKKLRVDLKKQKQKLKK